MYSKSISTRNMAETTLFHYFFLLELMTAYSGRYLFLTAASRNIYAMYSDRVISPFFSKISTRSNTPIIAVLTVILISAVILVPAVLTINVFVLFLSLGSIAGLANLAVHLTSNF